MSTVVSEPTPLSSDPTTSAEPFIATRAAAEQRITIRGIPWDLYDKLSNAIDVHQHIRLTYDGTDLEIMTTGIRHEFLNTLIGRLINALAVELNIACVEAGQTTWKRSEIQRGIEADHCYFFDPAKLAMIANSLSQDSYDIADYPNPDLAIEIDISRSAVDRPGIYAALGVAEVWRFDGKVLTFEQLGDNGQYVPAEISRFIPIRPGELTRWLTDPDWVDKTAWERRLRAWIRTDLEPW